MTIVTFLLLLITINLIRYNLGASTDRVTNLQQILSQIQSIHPTYLYGYGEITPALAYLTKTPLLDNQTDTNPLLFTSGFVNIDTITSHLVNSKAVVISLGADLSDGTSGDYLPDIVNTNLFHMHCKPLAKYPIRTTPATNRLLLFTCPGK
jgi:hypothetical protein